MIVRCVRCGKASSVEKYPRDEHVCAACRELPAPESGPEPVRVTGSSKREALDAFKRRRQEEIEQDRRLALPVVLGACPLFCGTAILAGLSRAPEEGFEPGAIVVLGVAGISWYGLYLIMVGALKFIAGKVLSGHVAWWKCGVLALIQSAMGVGGVLALAAMRQPSCGAAFGLFGGGVFVFAVLVVYLLKARFGQAMTIITVMVLGGLGLMGLALAGLGLVGSLLRGV